MKALSIRQPWAEGSAAAKAAAASEIPTGS